MRVNIVLDRVYENAYGSVRRSGKIEMCVSTLNHNFTTHFLLFCFNQNNPENENGMEARNKEEFPIIFKFISRSHVQMSYIT
jgi:hypothetical protein